ncbi:hypothetical protein E2562_003224 [Oryza meyeriana var. granulata]|uniref:Uncharacterized protein n=1 Tax=Oryza meyeriana var. granulata TaxID=110450 RepID=A0A6G1EUU8_9ORYZ|nr:hypothetical protein E2562_003224 [Oryza meyeriana var. granulata]
MEFELREEDTRISTIIEFGSAYYQYNFDVLSRSRLVAGVLFVEVDSTPTSRTIIACASAAPAHLMTRNVDDDDVDYD